MRNRIMSFINCLKGKVKAGLLTEGQVRSLDRKFQERKQQYTLTMGDEDAATQAAIDVMSAEANLLADKKRNSIKAALMQQKVKLDLKTKVKKGATFDGAIRDTLESTYARKGSILKQYFVTLDKFADEFRSKWAGLYRKKDGVRQSVEELLGKSTDNVEAKQYSEALRKTFDQAHKRYKAAGGIIGDLENYFPQSHNKELVNQVPFEEWYSFIRPRLDTEKMIDINTGLPFTKGKLLKEMEEDYQGIVTNGRSNLLKQIEEGQAIIGKSKEISNKRMSSRFYRFKDADSFLEYNDKFGVGDDGLYDAIINHFESFARDTAILEKLGPKPNALMRSLELEMLAKDVSDSKRKWTAGMYQVLNGYVDSAAGESAVFSMIGNTKNLLSAALLGSAPISAIADTAYIAATAKINGLSATKTLNRYLKLLNPASKSDREIANRSGYIADIARGSALADVRFTGENMGGKATGWLAQFTNRASGLQAMTKAGADAASLELEATLAELVNKKTSWSKIDNTFRESLESHDITKKDWDIISKGESFSPKEGVHFLRSQDLMNIKGVDADVLLKVGTKIDDFSQTLRVVATNEPTLRTRAINTGAAISSDARRGTFVRGLSASITQFKSFPMTVMFNHIIPSVRAVKQGKYQHAGYTFLGTTLMGAIALQTSEVVKGRDLKDPEDWRFWGASVLKGGGLGIFGDFLFADRSRSKSTLAAAIGGPVVGLADNVLSTFQGNLDRLVGDDTGKSWDKFKRDTFNLAKRNTPAVSLWYSRLAVERLLLDHLEEAVDPNYRKRVRRLENRMIKESGQRYYWKKGETSPSRLPKIATKK